MTRIHDWLACSSLSPFTPHVSSGVATWNNHGTNEAGIPIGMNVLYGDGSVSWVNYANGYTNWAKYTSYQPLCVWYNNPKRQIELEPVP